MQIISRRPGSVAIMLITGALVPTCVLADLFVGTSGDDTLTGTPEADTLNGLGGADTMMGLGGENASAQTTSQESLYLPKPEKTTGPSGPLITLAPGESESPSEQSSQGQPSKSPKPASMVSSPLPP